MIDMEKLYEMTNPAKAFQAMNLSKLYDVKAQSKALKKSTDLVFELADLYQAQTRKMVEFCLEQNAVAMQEGQKLVNEWIAATSKAGSEFVSEVEANVKEATKVLELPKTTKATKAA